MTDVKVDRVTTAGIIEHAGTFLLLKKREDSSIGAVWEFPGGKCRNAESAQEALVRECKEETDLDVEVGEAVFEHFFTNKGTKYRLEVFRISAFSGNVSITSDHTDFCWISQEDMRHHVDHNFATFPLSPSDKKIFLAILLNDR